MCNKPNINVNNVNTKEDRSGLFNLVPMVELAANALAAVASKNEEYQRQQQQERRQVSPDQSKSYFDTSPSPISTVTSSMEFTGMCKLPAVGVGPLYYPRSCKKENYSDQEYDAQDKESSQETRNRRRGCRKSPRKKPTPADPGWTAKHHRRHFVHHNYHDHAHDPEESPILVHIDATTAKGGVVTPFPLVLYNMLDSVDGEGLSSIVSWQPHGRAFSVHDSQAFVRKVMPIFFRQSKISSFQRQLNLYGFARLTGMGPDKGAYYNEFFLRGRPDLTVHMQRTRVKGTGVRTSSNPREEPNFYEMDPVGMGDTVEMRRLYATPPLITPPLITSSGVAPRNNDMNPIFEYNEAPLCSILAPQMFDILENQGEFNPEIEVVLAPQLFNALCCQEEEMMDLDDVDVADMAQFLKDVDLSADDPPDDSNTLFGHDLNEVVSTSI
jgi:hypothetical protein